MSPFGSGDRSSLWGDRSVTENPGVGHPEKLALTWENTPRVTEGDRSSLQPDIKTRIRAGGPQPSDQSPSVTRTPWTYDGPLTDRARLTSCNRCRHVVLEAHVEGCLRATVDPLMLAPLAELRHVVAGGRTVRIWPDPHEADEARIAFRDVVHIRARPGRGLPVHQCDRRHGPPDLQLLATPPAPTPEDLAW